MLGAVFMNSACCRPRTDRRGQATPILKPLKMFAAVLRRALLDPVAESGGSRTMARPMGAL